MAALTFLHGMPVLVASDDSRTIRFFASGVAGASGGALSLTCEYTLTETSELERLPEARAHTRTRARSHTRVRPHTRAPTHTRTPARAHAGCNAAADPCGVHR